MIDALNRRGYHLFLWVAPWATGRDHQPRGGGERLSRTALALHHRLHQPGRRRRGGRRRSSISMHMGLSGLKLDRGDEDTPSSATDVYFDGRTGARAAQRLPGDLGARASRRRAARARRRLSRLSAQRLRRRQHWAVFSAGDVPGKDFFGTPTDLGLRGAILAAQHNAFNGFPIWGSDTGGYEQFADRERVCALARVQRLLPDHGNRRHRHARAVGHADGTALRSRR